MSLSKDTKNPRWKPLHMGANWNSRNRRIAKQRSKTNWYKGKPEVEAPEDPEMEFRRSAFSIHKEDTSIHREDVSSPQEDHQDQEPGKDTTEDDKMPTLDQKAGNGKATGWNPKKERGPGRGTVTLGGLRKIEKAKKRKAERKLRKKLGMNNVQMRKEMPRKLKKKGQIPPTRSVIFVDNSVGGELAKRFQEAEEEAGDTTGYRVRITESAGSPLSMLLPSTNPWGPQDCQRKECVTCAQDDNKRID